MTTSTQSAASQGSGTRVRICGPLTWDVFPDGRRPGGAVAYAARVAAAWGLRAQILAAGDGEADTSALAGHDLRRIDCGPTLTFEHRAVSPTPRGTSQEDTALSSADLNSTDPSNTAPSEATEAPPEPAGDRELRLRAQGQRPLTAADLPEAWPPADILLLAPLTPDDTDVAGLLAQYGAGQIALLGQGLQRHIDGEYVTDASSPTPALRAVLRPDITLFLSESEISGWNRRDLDEIVGRCERVVVTHGARGARIHRAGMTIEVAPAPAPVVRDTTGAGDVFATAFILALAGRASGDEAVAGEIAAAYAAASIATVGAQPLPTLDHPPPVGGR